MYEQINSQFLSLGKTFADAAVKAQGVALAGFEKIADVQLKAVEKQVNSGRKRPKSVTSTAPRPSGRRALRWPRNPPRSCTTPTRNSSASR